MRRLILLLLLLPPLADAGFIDGKGLLKLCGKSGDCAKSEVFTGYVAGVIDSRASSDIPCVPPDLSIDKSVSIVNKYMADNPEMLDLNAHNIVIFAISNAYPCKTTKTQ